MCEKENLQEGVYVPLGSSTVAPSLWPESNRSWLCALFFWPATFPCSPPACLVFVYAVLRAGGAWPLEVPLAPPCGTHPKFWHSKFGLLRRCPKHECASLLFLWLSGFAAFWWMHVFLSCANAWGRLAGRLEQKYLSYLGTILGMCCWVHGSFQF